MRTDVSGVCCDDGQVVFHLSAEGRLGGQRGWRGRMSAWEAEPGPVGPCIPLGRGDQRLLHFALMTRMRGLGIDSPHRSKWTPASRHLFQRPLRPRWVWRRVSSPGSPLRHSNLLLSFSNRRSVLMVIVICFSPAPGSR